ncbi:hypothetical protein BpHYR1_031636 [Brachionus plicatilis]|uniref:Uncharacterized protein n=1 Tax=Brachionus plicatilis TaxID=10195 RepID=A0A3M7S565_BRAPC|nr:hypothetical protein BpHYR1_031636 [Brachionus plicatilis]
MTRFLFYVRFKYCSKLAKGYPDGLEILVNMEFLDRNNRSAIYKFDEAIRPRLKIRKPIEKTRNIKFLDAMILVSESSLFDLTILRNLTFKNEMLNEKFKKKQYRELGILINSYFIQFILIVLNSQTREQKLIAKYVNYGSPNRLDRVGKVVKKS